jgi:2,3-bisphosphoglycerate-independent phosphoglycerate mutase
MRAKDIAERAAKEVVSGNVDVIVINFANPDMVGHTGVMDATVKAVEATDVALGIVIDALEKRGGVALITADHGNAEFMADPATGQAHTAHTIYPVPLIIFDPSYKGALKTGALFDVAPTFLAMLGIAKPAEMTGHDLRIAKI